MKILFLGGDLRQKYAFEYMESLGYRCKLFMDFELKEEIVNEISFSDAIIFPLPITKDGSTLNVMSKDKIYLSQIIDILPKGILILGGNIPQSFIEICNSEGYKIIDYYESEAFKISNALLSAEGAIYYAMDKISKTIYGSKIAIFGFGRIAKILAYMARSQGAEITVFARSDLDRVWSNIIGFETIKICDHSIDLPLDMQYDFDIVFNTIPSNIMNESFISRLPKSAVIIDLASSPYGIDRSLVEIYELNYYRELGIPGRYAPKSAGHIMAKTLINILEQEKNL